MTFIVLKDKLLWSSVLALTLKAKSLALRAQILDPGLGLEGQVFDPGLGLEGSSPSSWPWPRGLKSLILAMALKAKSLALAPRVKSLILFLQYFDTVGWVFWPVKTVSHITYTVLAGT